MGRTLGKCAPPRAIADDADLRIRAPKNFLRQAVDETRTVAPKPVYWSSDRAHRLAPFTTARALLSPRRRTPPGKLRGPRRSPRASPRLGAPGGGCACCCGLKNAVPRRLPDRRPRRAATCQTLNRDPARERPGGHSASGRAPVHVHGGFADAARARRRRPHASRRPGVGKVAARAGAASKGALARNWRGAPSRPRRRARRFAVGRG